MNCSPSPGCSCGFYYETVIHCLLYCPRYAAPRSFLLSAAAQGYGDGWYLLPDSKKLNLLLFGSADLSTDNNQCLFKHVQKYIRETSRFSKN